MKTASIAPTVKVKPLRVRAGGEAFARQGSVSLRATRDGQGDPLAGGAPLFVLFEREGIGGWRSPARNLDSPRFIEAIS